MDLAADRRTEVRSRAIAPVPGGVASNSTDKAAGSPLARFLREELALAVSFLGLAVMILAWLLPHALREYAFYPGLVVIAIGVVLTLRHGPDRPRHDAS
jgi:4-hydroxybenzoate polyprenyltransferase